MRRFVAAGAGVLVSAGIAIPTFADAQGQGQKQHRSTNKGGWIVCREHLTLHSSPGLKLTSPRAAQFSTSDVLESCSSRDPTINSGIAIVKNSSSAASCAGGGMFHGVARIRWNNGKVSRFPITGSFGLGRAMAQGKVVGGTEFDGESFKALDKVVIDQSVLDVCGSPMGIGILSADGEIEIGHTSIDGVPFVL